MERRNDYTPIIDRKSFAAVDAGHVTVLAPSVPISSSLSSSRSQPVHYLAFPAGTSFGTHRLVRAREVAHQWLLDHVEVLLQLLARGLSYSNVNQEMRKCSYDIGHDLGGSGCDRLVSGHGIGQRNL